MAVRARWLRGVCLLLCLRAGVEAQDESAPASGPYPVGEMLAAASDYVGEAGLLTAGCAPEQLGGEWRTCFQASVDAMLLKTRRGMQRGLQDMAACVLVLLDAAEAGCSKPRTFQTLREQAARLQVLASARSLASLDAKHVRYEPLKSLTIADVDIHVELNELLAAWQMNKGPARTGQGLAKFLGQFASEEEAPQPAPAAAAPAEDHRHHAKTAPQFWADSLNTAFETFGDSSRSVLAGCVSEESLRQFSESLDDAFFERMMKRTQAGMQAGLKALSRDVQSFLDLVEAACISLKGSSGAQQARAAAARLQVLSTGRNLFRSNAQVDYEAMKALKVGGVDVHLELNDLIVSWRDGLPAHRFGQALGKFLSDFRPQAEEEEAADKGAADPEHPLRGFLLDAFGAAAEAAGRKEQIDLRETCFPKEVTDAFVKELADAIGLMLERRKRTMQQGLKGLADATERLLKEAPTPCIWSAGAKTIWLAAKKLRALTRRTVVDYGTYIKYEALKSLRVADVPIHTELNGFLVAWKLHGQDEAGRQFGKLMQRLSTVVGHDEL